MKAIVLAAGYGNRMRPLTDARHKTLLEIGGQTIIDRIIDGLLENGVRDILVVTGYRADELEAHLAQRRCAAKFSFVQNERYRETNNIFSLALAFEHSVFDDDVLLIESDLVCDPSVFERIVKTHHQNAALVARYRTGLDGTVVTVSSGIVTGVIPPHLQTDDFSFADKFKTLNIYKFSKEFCRTTFRDLLTYYAKSIDANCYYELILGILIYVKRALIGAEIIEHEKWAEVDDPNDLRVAELTFNPAKKRALLDETLGGYWSVDITDFCYLKNAYFPTPSMLAELKNNLPKLVGNYGSKQAILNEKLGLFLLCRADRVHALNGASQIFPFLAQYLAGKSALLPEPTFGEYLRIFPRHEAYPDALGVDCAHVSARAADADVIVFVNPNNPSGSTVPTRWLYELAQREPTRTFIVDESFIDFSEQPSIVPLLEQEPLENVIVVVSLSKSLGIPGVRLGYVYTADPLLHARIADWLPIWNLNSIAEHVLEIVLKHRVSLAESFRATVADRNSFASALERLPAIETVHAGGGNFVLVALKREYGSGAALVSRLLDLHAIYVKDASSKFSDNRTWLRLAVRLPSENQTLVAALAQLTPQ